MKKILFLIILIVLVSCYQNKQTVSLDYCQYVNAFIGNADNGHTFPGACAPFGLIQAGPESGHGSWRYCSGYNYDDEYIEGFSQTHLNGTGVGDLGDILLFPFSGDFQGDEYKSKYDKTTHKALAGYYFVSLTDADVDVHITATSRTAFHKYKFNGKKSNIYLDLQRGVINKPEDLESRVIKADVSIVDNKTITGCHEVKGWVRRKFFYVIKFDQSFEAEELPMKETEKAKRFILSFDNEKIVQTKIAISTVSIEGAMAAMDRENPDWNFDAVKDNTQNEWNNLLSRVEVTSSEDDKINFYTSLYRLFIQPNNIADIDGKYRGANDSVYTAANGDYYSTFSLWDTYRAAHPLYTILTPEKVDGFVQSMLAHHKAQGYLPIWTLWGKENHCMIGNHSIPVIVDAYLKGFGGFDADEAYNAIIESANTKHWKANPEMYMKYGYYPFDLMKLESVSRTLESNYDDYCVAMMAKALGKTEDYELFMKRADFYKNLLDPETKLMRGKDSNGNWRTPFDSFLLSHAGTSGGDYTEGNAWQYTWHVQHDVEGLIELMGGKEDFANKLDSLFFLESTSNNTGFVKDVTGLIGQYAHGNEPSHHVIYMYNYVERRDKTQSLIREVFDRFYKPEPDGLCGNDDCGQMSAWYIFSAMGFYPVNPCGGEYIIGAPQVEKIVLNLPDGKQFIMQTENLSGENKYVKGVSLNGKEISDFRIHHNDIKNGGVLEFVMTNIPHK